MYDNRFYLKAIQNLLTMCEIFVDDDNHAWYSGKESERINPFWNRTIQGVGLEMYYGLPSNLWTPFGQITIFGGGSGWWKDWLNHMGKHTTYNMHQGLIVSDMGEYGPVYEIRSIGDIQIPELQVMNKPYPEDNMRELWKSFFI